MNRTRESQMDDLKQLERTNFVVQDFFFYKPACLQKDFHGLVLSIRVFSWVWHYGQIVSVSADEDYDDD